MRKLPIFVISDIHAFDGNAGAGRPSYFDIQRPENEGADNPVFDLKKLIVRDKIKAEYLVVCGDLGDRAHPAAIERVWKEIQQLKIALNATKVIATVGNHDVDSRHVHNDHDAKGLLLELEPGFPFEDMGLNNQFWTHHFCCFEDPHTKVRFIVLNSSGYHGEHDSKKTDAEYVHGRISNRTLRRLKKALDQTGRAPANILICHHHPQKHDEHYLGDYDDMRGGAALLATLNGAEYGPWLVIHGHKHHPKLSYAQGGTDSPVIFSAGSCAAVLQPELQCHARNQAYRLEIDVKNGSPTSNCTGIFDSWEWGPGVGWKPAQPGSGLPSHGGFGFRGDLGQVAEEIHKAVTTEEKWSDVKKKVPAVCNVLPSDLPKLCTLLTTQLGFKMEEGNGEPFLIQR